MKREELVQEVARLQAEGQRVVFTNGCFDILHAGHVRYLNAAKADCVVPRTRCAVHGGFPL